MSNENSNPTIDSSDSAARLDLLTEQFEALKNGLRAIESTLVNFPGMVVAALSGQPQPTITTTAHESRASVAPTERHSTGKRGRPVDPNSARQIAMRAKAEASEVKRADKAEKVADKVAARSKEMHHWQRSILDIVTAEKRVSQSDLADRLGIDRSKVRHHALELTSRGQIVPRIVKPVGKHEEIIYYRADRASFAGE